jgi:hypothetical protein
MAKQKDLLRQGLVMLIMYANGAGLARSAVEGLATKHDRHHLAIDPSLYRLWLKSLLACVKRYDPKWDSALEARWNEVLAPGIAAMTAAY